MRIEPKRAGGGLIKKLKYGVGLALGLEVASLIGSYLLWRKMNRDQDFRYKVHQLSPYVLNYYYKVGEKLGSSTARQDDAEAWGIKTS